MPDENNTNTPEQQEPSSGQQDGGSQTDWESRFKGLQRKYNAQLELDRERENELAELRAKVEKIEKQNGELAVQKDALMSENQLKIDELTRMLSEKEGTVKELSSYQKKVTIAKELGHPELIRVIDSIPNSENEDDIKKAFQDIVSLTQDLVKMREEQLLEGNSPGGVPNDAPVLPSSQEGWMDYVNKFPLGSNERQDAMDKWFEFNQRQG